MATPVLTTISPSSGPPGTAITCLGSGFDPTAQVGCPAPVATAWVSATQLTAAIPADLAGDQGAVIIISVYVQNADLSISALLPFSCMIPYPQPSAGSWTNIDAVCAELPGFKRGGIIADASIEGWMQSVAQSITGVLVRRGMPIVGDTISPPVAILGVLEMINRLGAAARLATVHAAMFTAGKSALADNLTEQYEEEYALLEDGGYDMMWDPAAALEDVGPFFGAGAMTDPCTGNSVSAFSRESLDGGPMQTSQTVSGETLPPEDDPIGF